MSNAQQAMDMAGPTRMMEQMRELQMLPLEVQERIQANRGQEIKNEHMPEQLAAAVRQGDDRNAIAAAQLGNASSTYGGAQYDNTQAINEVLKRLGFLGGVSAAPRQNMMGGFEADPEAVALEAAKKEAKAEELMNAIRRTQQPQQQ